jgi:hypothetical protein
VRPPPRATPELRRRACPPAAAAIQTSPKGPRSRVKECDVRRVEGIPPTDLLLSDSTPAFSPEPERSACDQPRATTRRRTRSIGSCDR